MGAGLAGFYNDGKEKKHEVYVEEYVLSYLKREADSLQLSEIYFYGQRENGGRKILVYGAGREKGIAAFAGYELLTELVCRLTQAGPVFMLRGADGACKAVGFQVFYENNEAMQSFLIGWTGSAEKGRTKEESAGRETAVFPVAPSEAKMKKQAVHGAISVQLCLIMVALVAIVISSTDSYDKMEQLGQSAKEVFFAIENQETEQVAEDPGEKKEILVERNVTAEKIREPEEPVTAENADRQQEPDFPDKETAQTAAAESDKEPQESVLEPAVDKQEESPDKAEDDEKEEDDSADAGEEEDKENKSEEDTQDDGEQSDEENEEALSRSITRYYEVEKGDTLYTISQKIYGDISRVEKICEVNQISDPDTIRSGQKIILP